MAKEMAHQDLLHDNNERCTFQQISMSAIQTMADVSNTVLIRWVATVAPVIRDTESLDLVTAKVCEI